LLGSFPGSRFSIQGSASSPAFATAVLIKKETLIKAITLLMISYNEEKVTEKGAVVKGVTRIGTRPAKIW
jgi:hypothetical protein